MASLTRTAANLRGEAGDRDVTSIPDARIPGNADVLRTPPASACGGATVVISVVIAFDSRPAAGPRGGAR